MPDSVALIPRIGVELIPKLSQGEFSVEFNLPPGTPIEQTDRALRTVQNSAKAYDDVRTTFAVAGTGNRMDANPNQGGENWGQLNVTLVSGASSSDEQQSMEKMRASSVRFRACSISLDGLSSSVSRHRLKLKSVGLIWKTSKKPAMLLRLS